MKSSTRFWGCLTTKTALATKASSMSELVAMKVNDGVGLLRAIQTQEGPSGTNGWHLFDTSVGYYHYSKGIYYLYNLNNGIMN